MARSRSRGGRAAAAPSGRGRTTAAPAASKATSRKKKAPAVAEIEVVEEERGSGIDDGIAILTTIILLVAIVFMDREMGRHYGAGLLFKGSYQPIDTGLDG